MAESSDDLIWAERVKLVRSGEGPERESQILCVECRSRAGDKTRENEKFTETLIKIHKLKSER